MKGTQATGGKPKGTKIVTGSSSTTRLGAKTKPKNTGPGTKIC